MTTTQTASSVGHRVRFATTTIKPKLFPHFVYTASVISFDCIHYTAIVFAQDVESAIAIVKECWPDAEIRAVVHGEDQLRSSDTQCDAAAHGLTLVERGFWARMHARFFIR